MQLYDSVGDAIGKDISHLEGIAKNFSLLIQNLTSHVTQYQQDFDEKKPFLVNVRIHLMFKYLIHMAAAVHAWTPTTHSFLSSRRATDDENKIVEASLRIVKNALKPILQKFKNPEAFKFLIKDLQSYTESAIAFVEQYETFFFNGSKREEDAWKVLGEVFLSFMHTVDAKDQAAIKKIINNFSKRTFPAQPNNMV